MESVYLLVALGAIVAGFVQGLSGFAFGMVAMSFWAWGLEPRLAATLSVFGALVGQLVAVFTVRRGFNLRLLLPFVLGGLAGIPLGVMVLPQLDMEWFKALLGGFLALWCPVMLMARSLPPIRVGGRLGDAIAGMAGGVLSGIGGFAGPGPPGGRRSPGAGGPAGARPGARPGAGRRNGSAGRCLPRRDRRSDRRNSTGSTTSRPNEDGMSMRSRPLGRPAEPRQASAAEISSSAAAHEAY
ncbi:hypothetical protein G6F31_012364 [Rhizopus arrhizus]|nr:hypothetical protein G6F31_012364 [Rhizopus arrhizus]